MNQKEILNKVKIWVKEIHENENNGHDFFHVQRVVNNTKNICEQLPCNAFYAELLAWLHDVGDYKLHNGSDQTQEMVSRVLADCGFPQDEIEVVVSDVKKISFKGGFNEKSKKVEVLIVQDADRLDAIGAIGIARAFAYGGSKNSPLYEPQKTYEEIKSEEEYKNSESSTIQHFYDKLLQLKNRMNTAVAKEIAIKRHAFMLRFLEVFYDEWNGRS